MVQFAPILPTHIVFVDCRERSPDTYWKLGFHRQFTAVEGHDFFKSQGYRVRKGITKLQMMKTVGRIQRGLLRYGNCNIQELREFCTARRVIPNAKTALGHATALEEADDEVTFPNFLALPPEIRNTIYELHMRSFDEVPAVHRQPPLVMASKQLRIEALALFYEFATFTFDCWRVSKLFEPHNITYSRSGDPDRFVKMPQTNFERIKRLKFCLGFWTPHKSFEAILDYSLGLQSPDAVSVTGSWPITSQHSAHSRQAQRTQVQANLLDVVLAKIQDEGKLKLRKIDLKRIELAIGCGLMVKSVGEVITE